jgi:hypothetical protein
MKVNIRITYISNGNKVLQQASFPITNRKPEEVAFEWWKQIRREMPYFPELEKVLTDGEDITQLVKEIDKTPLED